MRILRLALPIIAAALLLAGCGTPGAPLPPTLDLPQPPSDLKAMRKGDKVTLTWTVPTQTTDRALMKPKHLGPAQICRGEQPVLAECGQSAGAVPAAQLAPGKPATYTDTVSQPANSFATYAVDLQNDHGRSGGLSNQVQVPLAPTLPAPAEVRASVTAGGPKLTWAASPGGAEADDVRHFYRITRAPENSDKSSVVGEVPANTGEFTDPTFEWEAHYVYRVTPITAVKHGDEEVQIEGDDSAPVTVFVHDVFPPAVPSGVQAVYSGLAQQKFIDLTWAPVTDADLAGYSVYRHEEGAAPVKISGDLVKTPAFRDSSALQGGHKYFYSVSAIDLRGNESAKSAETSEQVP